MIERRTVSEADWRALLSQQISLHGRLLFGAALGILRDPVAAEDAVQQALLKAWEGRTEIRRPEVLKSWLMRTVATCALEALRRRKVEKKVLRLQGAASDSDVDVAKRSDVSTELFQALSELPEPMRSVVVLRFLDGLSGNEVKELLACSASEVSRLLHAGLERLRELMAGSLEGAKDAKRHVER